MQFDVIVAALEDKIVQRATVAVLNAIYEEDFLGFSYGFRAGRGPHDALDALVVGINSDRSVRECKGQRRPIVPESERAEVLAALECVDHVFIFDEPTPARVIAAIVPDVLVKGADWDIDEIVGRETVERAGGVVRNIPLAPGASTSSILQRVLDRFGTA